MLSDEWLSRYGLLENFNASVTRTRTRTGTGTWTTEVTAIALCTSCSRAKNNHMIDSSTGEANTHMYWTGFTLITCKNSIAGPIVNTQSVVVLVWIILGVSIKPGLCYDIPESLYGRTGIPYREHRTAVYRYIGISLHP